MFLLYNVYLFPCKKKYISFFLKTLHKVQTGKKKKQKQADYEQNLYRPLLSKYCSLSKTNFLKSLLIDGCCTTKKDWSWNSKEYCLTFPIAWSFVVSSPHQNTIQIQRCKSKSTDSVTSPTCVQSNYRSVWNIKS